MAKTDFLSWSTTAGNNTDIDSIGIQGTNAVNNFDNALRTLMAQLRRDVDGRAVYASKSANYTALANDNNVFFRFTAAATLSLTAVATLGANWHCTVWADGGDVTIDPDASETVNGAATLVIPNGNMVSLVSSGTAFFASGIPSLWTLVSLDAGAAAGPILTLYRNSASPAVSDIIGAIDFNGKDSAANTQQYARIFAHITDPTSGSEDSFVNIQASTAGTVSTIASFTGNAAVINGTLTVTG